MSFSNILSLATVGAALASGCLSPTAFAAEPLVVASSPANGASVVRMPDGTLKVYYREVGSHVASITSTDHGLSWSAPAFEFAMNSDIPGGGTQALVDSAGNVHLWYLQRGDANNTYPGNRHLDIWYNRTVAGQWQQPHMIWTGYTGAIRASVQTSNGTLVLPFAPWKDGSENLPANTGDSYTTAIYSNDGGTSWSQSSAQLTSPTFADYNGNNYGAIEPGIAQVADGTLMMMMRTQTGVLYETRSHDDGAAWSDASPTRFHSSNSPASLLSLDDGRLLMLWNNAQLPPRVDGNGVYGGRDALHAAISHDGGATWRGFREIYLDPMRHASPPTSGDRGTAYPHAVATADGHILVVTGQNANSRAILRFHPDFLYETGRFDDFTDGLSQWSAFTEFGPAGNFWRDRELGPRIFDTANSSNGRVLHLRRDDLSKPGDGATWNFPTGDAGTLTMRILLNGGFGGAAIALNDRFFNPTDDAGESDSIFRIRINEAGLVGGTSTILERNTWHELAIDWDVDAALANIMIDDVLAGQVVMRHPTENGVSYLYLRDISSAISTGYFVDWVHVNVTHVPEPAILMMLIAFGIGTITRRRHA